MLPAGCAAHRASNRPSQSSIGFPPDENSILSSAGRHWPTRTTSGADNTCSGVEHASSVVHCFHCIQIPELSLENRKAYAGARLCIRRAPPACFPLSIPCIATLGPSGSSTTTCTAMSPGLAAASRRPSRHPSPAEPPRCERTVGPACCGSAHQQKHYANDRQGGVTQGTQHPNHKPNCILILWSRVACCPRRCRTPGKCPSLIATSCTFRSTALHCTSEPRRQ